MTQPLLSSAWGNKQVQLLTKNPHTLPSADKLNQISVQSSTNHQTISSPQTSLILIEKSSKNINTTTGNINVSLCEQRMLTASITSNKKSGYKRSTAQYFFSM